MKLQEASKNEITSLPPAQRAAIALKSEGAEKQLRELVEKTSKITNVVDANGRAEAHSAGMSLKNARTAITKTGKAAREDATKFSQAVIYEEKRLLEISDAEEERVFKLRDDFDAKVAAEKAEKDRIEAERKAAIRAKIDAITGLALRHAGATAADLNDVLSELAQRTIEVEEFAEFTEEAKAALDTTAHALLTLRTAAQEREAEEAERQRLAEIARKQAEADRLELEKLRAQQAEDARIRAKEAARIDQERATEREAAAKAKADADRILAQQRADDAAARAALEKEIADMKAAHAAAAEVERKNAEAVRQKAEAAEKLERDHEEALEMDACWTPAEPPETRMHNGHVLGQPINGQGSYYSRTTFKDNGDPIMCNADGSRSVFCDVADDCDETKRPSGHEIVDVLVKHYGKFPETIIEWLIEIDFALVGLDLE